MRLDRGLRMADEGLGGGVLGSGAMAEEGRDGDYGEDPDDQDDHQELDQREPLLVATHPLLIDGVPGMLYT